MEAVEGSVTDSHGGAVGTQLNARQQRFVAEYLVDLNGGRAYERAGYKATGLSARVNASKLLTKPNVRAAITTELRQRAERLRVKADNVIRALAWIGLSDIASVVEWGTEDDSFWGDGPKPFLRLRPTDALLPCERAAIKEIKEGRYGLEIEFHDKVAALALLAKHFGLLNGQGKQDEDLVDGVPRIPLATLRELQRRNAELERKRREMELAHGRGGHSGSG